MTEKQEWPKEPWSTYLEASAQRIIDADGYPICEPIDFDHDTLTPERIVLCVNACAGLTNEELKTKIK